MPNTITIVAIVSDPALLRSLAFALEAHGYQVNAFPSWRAARVSAFSAQCIIMDGSLPRYDRESCLAILAKGVGVVLMTEDESLLAPQQGLRILHKPLSGADVLDAVASLRTNAQRNNRISLEFSLMHVSLAHIKGTNRCTLQLPAQDIISRHPNIHLPGRSRAQGP